MTNNADNWFRTCGPENPSANLVELHDVHYSRGDRQVFNGLNMQIPRGKVTAVCGEFLFVADIYEISKPNQLGIAATILPQCERYPT